jgi:hypothetical protein
MRAGQKNKKHISQVGLLLGALLHTHPEVPALIHLEVRTRTHQRVLDRIHLEVRTRTRQRVLDRIHLKALPHTHLEAREPHQVTLTVHPVVDSACRQRFNFR